MAIADRIALLDHGRLVQVGRPAEVYDQPHTRFVAEFIGTANCVPGRVTAANGHAAQFSCAFGDLPLPPGVQRAGAVTAAIRPERVALGSIGHKAHVTEVLTLGGTIETLVRMADGTVLTVHEPNGPPATLRQPGQTIHVSLRPEDLRLLAE